MYGSLVRGDFWSSQSDVDIYIVGSQSAQAATILCKFVPKLELVCMQSGYFVSQRCLPHKQRHIQLGLHGFDTVDNHQCLIGTDPLKEFPVARKYELVQLAKMRLRELQGHSGRSASDEPAKRAVEALKTAALLELIKNGERETRHKDKIFGAFQDLVPQFEGKEFSKVLWSDYRSGKYSDGEKSERFVSALVTTVVG